MSKKMIITITVSAVLLVIGAGVTYAYLSDILERQPEPKGGYTLDFLKQYVAENLAEENDAIPDSIPRYKEEDLFFGTGKIFPLGADAGYSKGFSFTTNFFERIVKMFPEPLVREIGDYIYLVYDTDNNTRLYLFFSKKKSQGMLTDGYPVIMKKKLAYKDFSQLQPGDNLQNVEQIDPVIPLYRRVFDEATDHVLKLNKEMGIYLTSVHLLADGILKIEYDRTDDGEYVITNIVYNEDFILDGLDGQTCYRIHEVDYVD